MITIGKSTWNNCLIYLKNLKLRENEQKKYLIASQPNLFDSFTVLFCYPKILKHAFVNAL
jgi:hypothetical protein